MHTIARTQEGRNGSRWRNEAQVADHLGVAQCTVRRLRVAGVLRAYHVGSRQIRFDLDDVDSAIRARSAGGPQ